MTVDIAEDSIEQREINALQRQLARRMADLSPTMRRRAEMERAQIRTDLLGITRRLLTERRKPWCCDACGCLNGPAENRCLKCCPLPAPSYTRPPTESDD